jgi:hypothetical protein
MNHKDGVGNLSEPLKMALAMEREGKKLIAGAARKTTSKLARETFQFLTAEEDKHIFLIPRNQRPKRSSNPLISCLKA